jgi:hypothetical protein
LCQWQCYFEPMTDLYTDDILLWSQTQSALLRRLAAGEQIESTIDWEHVAEEIECVGSEQLHAVISLLRQALVHMLKAQAWPYSHHVPHWQAEARGFRGDAIDRFAPSMRQHIDLDKIYQRALRALPETIDGKLPDRDLPAACPVALDELLTD